nr:MAG TPA: acetylglutamate kinase [Caudoviricetes sp.]
MPDPHSSHLCVPCPLSIQTYSSNKSFPLER